MATTSSKASAAKKPTATKRSKSSSHSKKSKPNHKVEIGESVSQLKSPATSKQPYARLKRWNTVLAVLHAVQGIAVLYLSGSGSFPLTTNYLAVDALQTKAAGEPVLASATRTLADVNLAYVVAAFFFMSAIAHLIIATVYRKRYEIGLDNGINRARWFEYAASASTMMIAIGFLVGLYDLGALLMLFTLTAVMNLLGLVMEVYNQKKDKVNWLGFIVGCVAGIVPWIVIALYLLAGGIYGDPAPTFVYWIFGSIFVFFNLFAVNMYLQYKGVGKWKDYIYGERMYMILSLVAKTVLAWQVFGGTLRP